MRIGVVFDCLYPFTTGGGEKQYLQFAREFARAGHEVVYLTRHQWPGSDATHRIEDGITARAITGPLELYDADGVRVPKTAAVFAAALFGHLARHRGHYDALVVSATPVLNVFAARAALLGRRTPVVVDWLEIWTREQWLAYSGPVMGRIANTLQHVAVRLSPLAAGHSQHTQDGALRNGLPPEHFLRSPGLIAEVADVTPRLTFEADAPGPVLFLGRHIQDKRVDALPSALARARATLPGLRAVIGGQGPETDAVRAAVLTAGVADAVDLPGFVEEAEVARLLHEALCLINPSKREGYGLVVVEAAGHGTPSIVVDHPTNASTELVTDGVNGFIAPSASPEDLADAIRRVHEGGEDLRRTTRAWYAEAIRTRTIAKTAEGILRVFETGRR